MQKIVKIGNTIIESPEGWNFSEFSDDFIEFEKNDTDGLVTVASVLDSDEKNIFINYENSLPDSFIGLLTIEEIPKEQQGGEVSDEMKHKLVKAMKCVIQLEDILEGNLNQSDFKEFLSKYYACKEK
jgi:hypothetical protein